MKLLATTLLFGAGCEAEAPSEAECEALARPPVIFVHGSGLSADSWDSMIAAFSKDGYSLQQLHAVDMKPRDGDNIAAARQYIAPAVLALLNQQASLLADANCTALKAAKVDVVAHSMGAASARWYASRIGQANVRTLITIAGANHGTNRLCGHPGHGDAQMCPAFSNSGLQALLNGTDREPVDETPYSVGIDANPVVRIPPQDGTRLRYFTIRIEPDEWIEPADSALLDGADPGHLLPAVSPLLEEGPPGNFRYRQEVRHDDLPADATVIRFVLTLLRSN